MYHLNPSSINNLILAISDLNHLDMSLNDTSIDYMSRIRVVSHKLQCVSVDKVIPLFAIAILEPDCCPVIKSQ